MAEQSPFREYYSEPGNTTQASRTFLGGMRLGTRVSLFVLLSLLLLAGAGGLFYYADGRLSVALAGMEKASRISRLAARVELASARLKTDRVGFLYTQDLRFAESHKKRTEPLLASLKVLHGLPAALDVRNHVSTINDGVAQRMTQFSQIVEIKKLLGFFESQGLRNVVRSWATGLAETLRKSGNTPLIEQFARLRRLEARLMDAPSEKDLRALAARLNQFKNRIATTPLPRELGDAARELAAKYAADTTQLGRTSLVLTDKIARLGEIDSYMSPSIEGLVLFADDLTKKAARGLADAKQWAGRMLAGGGGTLLVLFVLVALTLMRSITRPITDLARAATQLAHGDRTTAIPALGNYDETGEVANALTFFRENMERTERLRGELEMRLEEAAQAATAQQAPEKAPVEAPEEEILDLVDPRSLITRRPDPGELSTETPISEITKQVAETSQLASVAAFEAERTEIIVNGLAQAVERTKEIEKLVLAINDQSSLLAVQTALNGGPRAPEDENLVVLSGGRSEEGGRQGAGQTVGERIDDIQALTRRAVEAIREIGKTIDRVNEVALEFAAETSNQALDAATDLLRQSEDLRSMLDDLLGKIRPEGGGLSGSGGKSGL